MDWENSIRDNYLNLYRINLERYFSLIILYALREKNFHLLWRTQGNWYCLILIKTPSRRPLKNFTTL